MKSGPAGFAQDKVRLIAVLVLIPLVASFFAGAHWTLELASHFQAHYLIVLALCGIGLLLFRDWRWGATVLLGASVAGIGVLPWFFGKPAGSPAGNSLRLLLSNVYTQNTHSGRLLELIRQEQIDVVVLEEIDSRWLQELEPLRERMPAMKAIARDDNFGIGIWSKFPLGNVAEFDMGPFGVPTISADFEVGGRAIRIIATHPVPPASGEGAAARDKQLVEIATLVQASRLPVVLAGDLNTTMWSPAYRRLTQNTALRDARQGFGVIPTWPAQLRGLGIPLDHCLLSPPLFPKDVRAGPNIGSDHLPLIVEIIVPPK